jgi:hypothetical protein
MAIAHGREWQLPGWRTLRESIVPTEIVTAIGEQVRK